MADHRAVGRPLCAEYRGSQCRRENRTILDESPELDQRLVHQDARSYLLAVIDLLPEEQKRAVLLYYYEQLTIAQIAEIEGVPETTIKSRLVLARKKIKAAVEAEERRTGTRLLAAGMPALAMVLAEGALLHAMPADLAARALTVALAAAHFIDGGSAVTYISTNEAEVDISLKDKLNRGIIVELKPRKIFLLIFLLAILALTGFLMVLEEQNVPGVPDDTLPLNKADETIVQQNAVQQNAVQQEPEPPQKQEPKVHAGNGADNPVQLVLNEPLEYIPEKGVEYWYTFTPEETGYYCFEGIFGPWFEGKDMDFFTYERGVSWETMIFEGSFTTGISWKDDTHPNWQKQHMYFTDDSTLQAETTYYIKIVMQEDFEPKEIKLIKTDIPFSP
ncbi:MAG: RNA polymerase sigma factor [Firmicutes bacterium]|nr:RNA polymerase sigma factor [Bacillota bacterium]